MPLILRSAMSSGCKRYRNKVIIIIITFIVIVITIIIIIIIIYYYDYYCFKIVYTWKYDNISLYEQCVPEIMIQLHQALCKLVAALMEYLDTTSSEGVGYQARR